MLVILGEEAHVCRLESRLCGTASATVHTAQLQEVCLTIVQLVTRAHKVKVEVTKVKQRPYDDLYARMDSKIIIVIILKMLVRLLDGAVISRELLLVAMVMDG